MKRSGFLLPILMLFATARADDAPAPSPSIKDAADEPVVIEKPEIATPPKPAKPEPRSPNDVRIPSRKTYPAAPTPAAPKVEIVAEGLDVSRAGYAVGWCGDRIELTLKETGPIKSRVWSILPETKGLKRMEHDAAADFVTRQPGVYQFFVSVASVDGQVAHAIQTIELKIPEEWTQAPGYDPVPPNPGKSASRRTSKGPETPVDQRVTEWLGEVDSDSKTADARMIAGVIRSRVLAQETGQLSPNADLFADVFDQVSRKLGTERYPAWAAFLEHLQGLKNEASSNKLKTGPSLQGPALLSIAGALEQ